MRGHTSTFVRLLAVLISGILAMQYIPVTLNGKTVIVQISCCKDLSECCASGVKACTTHRVPSGDDAYSGCQTSPETSDFMMVISKSMIPEIAPVAISFSEKYFSPFDAYLGPQNFVIRLIKPPKIALRG